MEAPICQVALSVTDLARSRSWYERLGLQFSGEMGPIRGPLPAQMLGLPEVDVRINWLLARDPMSQFELMHFSQPAPRPFARERNLCDAGYGLVGLVVPELDRALCALREADVPHTITESLSNRSIWTRDPDGVPVEIMERDPLGSTRAADGTGHLPSIRFISLTLNDLPRARQFWSTAVGLTVCSPNDYAFTDFPAPLTGGARDWEKEVLKGGTLLVRLLKPRGVPVRAAPPDRRLSDAGVLNIASILDCPDAFAALLERFRKRGYPLSAESAMTMENNAGAMYGHDDQGTSIELGYVLPGHEMKYGWRR